MNTSRRASLGVIPLLLIACAGTDPEAVDVAEVSDELRALRSQEVVGTIAYGETRSQIAYEETPTYRALSFYGSSGDDIVLDVRAEDADARAWLLASDYRTLNSNDNASAQTQDSRITHKLTRTGTYYVAFREKRYEDTTFSVTLSRKNANPPPSGADPFSSTYCAAAPMTQAQAVGRFAVGATHATVGNFRVASRSQTCNPVTGCTPWTTDARIAFWVSASPANYAWDAAAPATGHIDLDIVNSAIVPTLVTEIGGNGQRAPSRHRTSFSSGIDSPIELTDTQRGDWTYFTGPFWEGPVNSSVKGREGVLANHCLRYVVKARLPQSNQSWTDFEYVYYGTF